MLALGATALGYAGHGFLSDLLIVVFAGVPLLLLVYVVYGMLKPESELEKLHRELGPPTSSVNYRAHARLKRRLRVRKEDVAFKKSE